MPGAFRAMAKSEKILVPLQGKVKEIRIAPSHAGMRFSNGRRVK